MNCREIFLASLAFFAIPSVARADEPIPGSPSSGSTPTPTPTATPTAIPTPIPTATSAAPSLASLAPRFDDLSRFD